MTAPVLILPGYGNSGPLHWQTHWEQANPGYVRIAQRDWEHPECGEWVAAIEAAVSKSGPRSVLVAHSLGCLAVAHWAAAAHSPLAAAMLVAVPDPAGPAFPADIRGFGSTPDKPLGFRSIVVTSSNDPYGSQQHAEHLARAWGSETVCVGAKGHINSDSRLGMWPEGAAILARLTWQAPAPTRA